MRSFGSQARQSDSAMAFDARNSSALPAFKNSFQRGVKCLAASVVRRCFQRCENLIGSHRNIGGNAGAKRIVGADPLKLLSELPLEVGIAPRIHAQRLRPTQYAVVRLAPELSCKGVI